MILSVVIPAYNRDLSRSIASVALSTGIEIIVVDDCSQPPVSVPQAENIRLIRLENNSGPGHARNIGIEAAQGLYIAFLDSDDEFSVGVTSELLARLRGSSVDVALIRLREQTKSGSLDRKIQVVSSNYEKETLLGRFLSMSPVDKIYRREFLLFNNIKFPPIRGYEDISFVRQVSRCLRSYVAFPDLVYTAHLVEGSVSRNARSNIDSIKYLIAESSNVLRTRPNTQEIFSAANLRIVIFEMHRFARRAPNFKAYKFEHDRLNEILVSLLNGREKLDFKYNIARLICKSPFATYYLNRVYHRITSRNVA